MKIYEHIREFDVKQCDVDFKDELKPSQLLSYLEEAACSSADELGFGYGYLKRHGYAFMLTNIRCEIRRPISLGERILVKTWPTPPSHVVFGREYKVTDKNGNPYVDATARWCMINMENGKILKSSVLTEQDYSSYNPARALDVERWKTPPFAPAEGEMRFSMTVANSEYDHNMHVNNTRYADYCFNCFSVRELAEKRLKGFCLGYVKQCREGDRLDFYRRQEENGVFFVRGFNDSDQTVMQAEILFEDIQKDI